MLACKDRAGSHDEPRDFCLKHCFVKWPFNSGEGQYKKAVGTQ